MAQKTLPTNGATIHLTQERWEKTPAYARDEIARLSYLLDAAEREVKERRLENPASRVFVDPYGVRAPFYLHARDQVVLRTGALPEDDRREIRVTLKEDHQGTWYVEVYGSEKLVVLPWVTNVIRVESRPR